MAVFTGLSNWLTAMKIGAKLVLGFLLVLALTALIGGFSILKLAQVNAVSSELALKWMPSIGYTTTMRSSMLEVRDLEVKHAHASDVGYMEEYEEKMKSALAIVTANSKDYEKLIGGSDEKKLFDTFTKAWAEYLTFNTKVVAFGRANKPEDAKEIGDGASKSTSDDAISALDKLTALNFTGGKAAAEHANAVYNNAKMWTVGLLAAALLIGMSVALVITRNLLRQLGGEPSYATLMTTAIADGKLYVDVALRDGDSDSLLAGIKHMRDNLAKMVTEVRSGIDTISTASSQIAAGNLDLSSRTEQQASSLEETASSMEELTSTVKQNADNARQANQLAMTASDVAVKGGSVVSQVVSTMGSINDSAKKIVDIIGVIDGIAFQTNILALNAAVEAARAGEQGRGFAVVASEVRSLAQRSAAAAKEIKTLIGDSVEKVDAGSKLVNEAGTTMDEIVASIKRVTDIMGEITAASQEQSAGIEQVNQAIAQMDQVTQQNAALVEEAAAAAESLQDQAGNLAEVVSIFKLDNVQHLTAGVSVRSTVATPVKPRSEAVRAALPSPAKL